MRSESRFLPRLGITLAEPRFHGYQHHLPAALVGISLLLAFTSKTCAVVLCYYSCCERWVSVDLSRFDALLIVLAKSARTVFNVGFSLLYSGINSIWYAKRSFFISYLVFWCSNAYIVLVRQTPKSFTDVCSMWSSFVCRHGRPSLVRSTRGTDRNLARRTVLVLSQIPKSIKSRSSAPIPDAREWRDRPGSADACIFNTCNLLTNSFWHLISNPYLDFLLYWSISTLYNPRRDFTYQIIASKPLSRQAHRHHTTQNVRQPNLQNCPYSTMQTQNERRCSGSQSSLHLGTCVYAW